MVDITSPAPPYPVYLQPGQTRQAITARMVARLQGKNIDLSDGSWEMDWVLLQVQELLLFPDALWRAIKSSFMLYPECAGVLVDYKAAEENISRTGATVATVVLTFTAPAGTIISALTKVSVATSSTGGPPVVFVTQVAVTVPVASTTVTVIANCMTSGPSGNVPAGALTILLDPVPGVPVTVTNALPSTGGLAAESDASVKSRYFDAVRNRGTSGNPAQWRGWALGVQGVGNVAVGRTPAGGGSVALSLLGTDGGPASPAVVQAVKDYILGTPTRTGVASIGPTDIRIYAAPVVLVDVSAVVFYQPLAVPATVRSIVNTGLTNLFSSLNFNATDNSIHPDQVGVVISQAPGVAYYDIATLRVAGSSLTVPIPWDSIAQLRTLSI